MDVSTFTNLLQSRQKLPFFLIRKIERLQSDSQKKTQNFALDNFMQQLTNSDINFLMNQFNDNKNAQQQFCLALWNHSKATVQRCLLKAAIASSEIKEIFLTALENNNDAQKSKRFSMRHAVIENGSVLRQLVLGTSTENNQQEKLIQALWQQPSHSDDVYTKAATRFWLGDKNTYAMLHKTGLLNKALAHPIREEHKGIIEARKLFTSQAKLTHRYVLSNTHWELPDNGKLTAEVADGGKNLSTLPALKREHDTWLESTKKVAWKLANTLKWAFQILIPGGKSILRALNLSPVLPVKTFEVKSVVEDTKTHAPQIAKDIAAPTILTVVEETTSPVPIKAFTVGKLLSAETTIASKKVAENIADPQLSTAVEETTSPLTVHEIEEMESELTLAKKILIDSNIPTETDEPKTPEIKKRPCLAATPPQIYSPIVSPDQVKQPPFIYSPTPSSSGVAIPPVIESPLPTTAQATKPPIIDSPLAEPAQKKAPPMAVSPLPTAASTRNPLPIDSPLHSRRVFQKLQSPLGKDVSKEKPPVLESPTASTDERNKENVLSGRRLSFGSSDA